ncbi:hypothetical protein CBR_g28637 [Chara braunii]|uniref:Integrase catalytic domain-containing protein n=1 Tax=Chara braunii TaxID=69332 RepID=A0A388L9L6_CHABU|nr:hypothetical protein CBR_g28637 [Chara braunii]|eukprot:GBG78922.1 hypothetical protein CBR_g28637 [Chara braunii]
MSGSEGGEGADDDRRLTRLSSLRIPRVFQTLQPGEERRLRAEARARNLEAAREATAARAVAMATSAASAANSTGQGLGMLTSSQSISSTSRVDTSQMAGSQFSSPPPRTREQMELQQVDKIRLRLDEELRRATKREKEIEERSVRLEGREADMAALEALEDSAFNTSGKILKASVLSMHAYIDSKMDAMQDTLDHILQALHKLGIRPTTIPSLPLSAMTDLYAAQSGPPPSVSSTVALSQIVASSSSGPATVATPQSPSVLQPGQQYPWYPKTPLNPPATFSGDKKDEALDTWLRTVPVWVRAKRALVEEEVITGSSYLEGSAARWLNGLVASKGFGRNMHDWAHTHTLESFMDLVEAHWHNPQEAQIATDGLLKLDTRKYKSVRELTTAVERLIVVPGVEYNPQVLLTMFLRCLPTDIRNLLASEARKEYHTFESFNKKALDLEATLGGAQTPSTDGRKKKTLQEWKKKGSRLMMVDSDGNQTEIDDVSELVAGSEFDGEESDEGSNLAAVVKTKAAGRGKGGQQRSQGQAANPNKIVAWVRAGLDQEVWRDRWSRGVCINCNYLGALISEFGLSEDVTRSLEEAYKEDPITMDIINKLQAKDKATTDEFVMVDGLLFLEKAGFKSANLVQRFRWPNMLDDVKKYVETCRVCQRDKPRTQAPLGLLKPLPIPAGPGQSISMDFMDTLVTSKNGKRHIFFVVDRFTKYARLIAVPEIARTEHVIKLFIDNWARDFGLPKTIVSDRDVRFTSEMWKKAAEQMASQLQMTSGNHPEANGQAEQMNRVVQHLLRYYIKPNQDDWDKKLPLIASLYNNAVHNTTGVSPNQLHLGWKPRSALDFLLRENRTAATPGTIEFGVQYEKLLQQTVEHIKKSQEAMIASENKHRRQSTFQVGERVWVKASELGQEFGISRKLMPQYFGPWEVLDIVGNDMDGPSYVIRIPGHLRTYPVFHASKLAPFAETAQFPSRRSMLPPTMDGHVDVDDILDHRDTPVPKPPGRGRPPKPAREYRVHFRHQTDPKEDRWIPREKLVKTAPQIVADYLKRLKGKAPA